MKKTYLTFLSFIMAAFSVQAQDPTTAIVPNTPSSDVVNIFSGSYTPNNRFSNKAVNNFRATAADIVVGGNTIIKFTFLADNATNVITNYSQSEFATNLVDASSMNFFHIDIYNPATGGSTIPNLTIKLVDFGADGLNGNSTVNADNKEGQVSFATPAPGTWGSFNIAMSAFGTNLLNQRTKLGAMLITASESSNLYVDNVYFSSTSTYTTLPVTLTDFVAKTSSNGAVLNWRTASEEKFNGFEVEHRTDNSDFKAINGAFISGGKNTYSYTHNNPVNGNNYYRLKMVDQDGTFEYSDIEVIQYGLAGADVKVQCYPNPVAEQLNIGFNASAAAEAIISLQDLQGRTISQTKVNAASGDNQSVINTSSLNKGVYLVSISLNGKLLGSQKVVK